MNQVILSVQFIHKNSGFPAFKKSLIGFENTIFMGNLVVELSTDLLFKKKRFKIQKPDRIVYF